LKIRGVGVKLKNGCYILIGYYSPLSVNIKDRLLSTLSLLAIEILGVSLPMKMDSIRAL